MGRKVEWSEVQGLQEPTLFGDVLNLPINGFGSGQKHSHSGDTEYGEVLAKHHFGRSWYHRPPDAVETPSPSPSTRTPTTVDTSEVTDASNTDTEAEDNPAQI